MRSLSLLCVVGVATLCSAPAFGAGPTCALLDPDKDPRAALLETKLLADASATWVERAGIDKVLKEQKLQALFSPQGVGERVRLGQLLKADVLVMVRAVKGAESPTLEVVVSETASGLRLMHRAVPITKSTNDDVAALLAAVKGGISRHGEKITEVFAVPPFVSNDLEFTHDYLKGALSKLAESEALGRKGAVVVELAEAESLAKEIALTDPGARANRPLPVYLMGEFRNEGKGKDRTISLTLRAERGGKLLVKAAELKSKAGEESDAVRKWAAGTLDELAKDVKPRPLSDPKVEAKVLAERAKVLSRLANWPESLALIEASLLLDPDQLELRAEAIKVLRFRIQQSWYPFAQKLEEVRIVHRLYRRGLDLFSTEVYLLGYGNGESTRFLLAPNGLSAVRPDGPGVELEMAEMRAERRELLLRLIPELVKRGKGEETHLVEWAVFLLPAKDRFAVVEKLVLDLQDVKGAEARAIAFVGFARDPGQAPRPVVQADEDAAYRDLLKRLAEAKSPALRSAAATLETRWKAEVAKKPVDPITPGTAVGSAVVKIQPIQFARSAGVPRPNRFDGVLAVGPGVDVVWAPGALFVMKEKGKLRSLWTNQGRFLNDVCFDGKYVWAATSEHKKWATLLVADPVSEKVWELTGADGIPQGTPEQEKELFFHRIVLGPLGPGKVCAASSFGRTWVATIAFEPSPRKVAVKILHEAREAQDPNKKEQLTQATVDFCPTFILPITRAVTPGGKAATRVVIGRGGPHDNYGTFNPVVPDRPLVVDLNAATVEVARDPWPGLRHTTTGSNRQFQTRGDASYWLGPPHGKEVGDRIYSITPADLNPRPLPLAMPPSGGVKGRGMLLLREGRWLVVREVVQFAAAGKSNQTTEWWVADLDGKNAKMLAAGVARVEQVSLSSHYGLVGVVVESMPLRHVLSEISISQTPSK